MSGASFAIAPLGPEHDRAAFSSGKVQLDHYFRQQVFQDIRRRVTVCFVATAPNGTVAGYYTLAASSVVTSQLPPQVSKKLPRYPSTPAVLMGRLAVDQAYRGQGLGAALLGNALLRAARSEIPAYAMIVDAMDDEALAFYLHHGFTRLPDTERSLFLPLASLK